MEREKIILKINENHKLFIEYVSNLSKDEFEFSKDDKWSAGQHLTHIVFCIKATLILFRMDKSITEQNLGKTDRQNLTYEELQSDYQLKAIEGAKAPARFIPETITIDQAQNLIEKLSFLVEELGQHIETFSEQELDIPHPSLGSVTLREMIYNVAYQIEHHHLKAIANLN